MIINSRDFGQVEIDDDEILHFPEGIYAFEDIKRYALLSGGDEDNPFMWLQALEGEKPCFIVLDPLSLPEIFSSYKPCIPQEALDRLELTDSAAARVLVIAVIRDELADSTVNLASPLVINSVSKTAMQVLLQQEEYGYRHKLFAASGGD